MGSTERSAVAKVRSLTPAALRSLHLLPQLHHRGLTIHITTHDMIIYDFDPP